MTSNLPPNGWAEWSKYVLKELERQNNVIRELVDGINELKQEVARREEREKAAEGEDIPDRVGVLETQMARMQVRAGIWGAIGAAIPVIVGYLLSH